MSDFSLYFSLGTRHIANLHGIDHILFITALCIRYQFTDWKQLLILITIFTIGNAATHALSASGFLLLPLRWIEFLVPLTIFVAAVSNLFIKKVKVKSHFPVIYFITLFFGLIHGFGVIHFYKRLSDGGNIFVQLLAFNLGVEAGQLLVLAIVLGISLLCLHVVKINRRDFTVFLSGGIVVAALQMFLQRWPW